MLLQGYKGSHSKTRNKSQTGISLTIFVIIDRSLLLPIYDKQHKIKLSIAIKCKQGFFLKNKYDQADFEQRNYEEFCCLILSKESRSPASIPKRYNFHSGRAYHFHISGQVNLLQFVNSMGLKIFGTLGTVWAV